MRDATGNATDRVSSVFGANCTDAACSFGYDFSSCKSDGVSSCKFGLQNDFQVGPSLQYRYRR